MPQQKRPPEIKRPEELTGLIYGTSVDSDAWQKLLDVVGQAVLLSSEKELEQAGHEDAERFEKILSHFNLACAIADQMLTYQEAGQFLEQSLAHLAFGLAFFDDSGDLIWANTEMQRLASGGNMGSSIISMDLAPQNGGESCFPIPRSSKLNEN